MIHNSLFAYRISDALSRCPQTVAAQSGGPSEIVTLRFFVARLVATLKQTAKRKNSSCGVCSLQFTTFAILQYKFYTQLCVNNIEVTINPCKRKDVFIVIITKTIRSEQLQHRWPWIYGCSKQTSSLSFAFRLDLFTDNKSLPLCYNYNINQQFSSLRWQFQYEPKEPHTSNVEQWIFQYIYIYLSIYLLCVVLFVVYHCD